LRHFLVKLLNWAALLILLLASAAPAHADVHGATGARAAIVEMQATSPLRVEAPAAPTEPAIHCGTPLLGLIGPVPIARQAACRLVYQPGSGWAVAAQPPGFDPPPPRIPLTA